MKIERGAVVELTVRFLGGSEAVVEQVSASGAIHISCDNHRYGMIVKRDQIKRVIGWEDPDDL